jgi:thymidine kinase
MKPVSYLGQGHNPGRFHPGCLEVIYGPMKAKKSAKLIERVDAFNYSGGLEYIAFKPEEDTRTPGKIVSRMGALDAIALEIPAIDIPKDDPYRAKAYVKDKHGLIVIDEAQLFSPDIVYLVKSWIKEKRNIVVAGLSLNFRREAFGSMSHFITHATLPPIVLFASCAYKLPDETGRLVPCSQIAQFTQRLIDGEPAPYHDDIFVVEPKESFLPDGILKPEEHKPRITYEPRCDDHHTVRGEPHHNGNK